MLGRIDLEYARDQAVALCDQSQTSSAPPRGHGCMGLCSRAGLSQLSLFVYSRCIPHVPGGPSFLEVAPNYLFAISLILIDCGSWLREGGEDHHSSKRRATYAVLL